MQVGINKSYNSGSFILKAVKKWRIAVQIIHRFVNIIQQQLINQLCVDSKNIGGFIGVVFKQKDLLYD